MGLEGRVGGRGGVTGNMRCSISKRGTVGRKRGTGRVGERRRYDDTSCGGFRCRRNTPANRDPFRSPEQQDYVLRVDTHPHSAHFIRGEADLGCRIRREGQDWGEIRTKNKLPLS